ncbi:MAG: hypothetical protein JWO30_862 [Fibrobacteres bacterium]|nr:hypothetical protein [Fibrobacterota bacterium]
MLGGSSGSLFSGSPSKRAPGPGAGCGARTLRPKAFRLGGSDESGLIDGVGRICPGPQTDAASPWVARSRAWASARILRQAGSATRPAPRPGARRRRPQGILTTASQVLGLSWVFTRDLDGCRMDSQRSGPAAILRVRRKRSERVGRSRAVRLWRGKRGEKKRKKVGLWSCEAGGATLRGGA